MESPQSRLLIVDDSEINRDMLARRLSRRGYEISMAESAHGLLERVRKENIDLILLDIEMPEITGLDALKALRQYYTPIQLPIIMVTARNQSEDVIVALELGANDYLTKPIDFPIALARIKTQLSHKRAENALRESEERYALAARGANDGLWDWNLVADIIYFSPRWKATLGYQDHEIGSSPEEWFSRIHEFDRDLVKRRIADHQNGIVPHFESEIRMLHKDGTYRWMLSRGVMVRDETGKPLRMAGSQTDITEGKVADPLTGLPNRLFFIERLLRLIEQRKRRTDALFAVLFLDLDGFKMINDSLGHIVGDKLLISVSKRLLDCLRANDVVARADEPFTVARLGGDEFAILLDHLNTPEDAKAVADRLMQELNRPFELDEKEIFTTVSIGIALSSSGYLYPEEFLRDADTAMYRAKSTGKARAEIFDADMRATITSRLQLETDLRHALQRMEFRNVYQPIVLLATGQVAGFEALLRWQHPERGLLGPAEFIPVAEETGLIRELGWWNLREACRQICEWKNRLNGFSELIMSVNLSVKQFQQPNLVGDIRKLLEELSLPAKTLQLELTESSVMTDPHTAISMLEQIKAQGICLAIDDFGTGYSSLSYLHRFPLNTVKIDRSFTSTMGNGGDGIQIVKTIMPLASNLGFDVVAEGVETQEQFRLLKELKCKYAQGYYFSKPLTAAAAEEFLAAQPSLAPV
jgi:diguanylate cyclase (GGDEF)-like protein/PAS domain S-box-containing protein